MGHKLESVTWDNWAGAFEGVCSCSEPDWDGDGWSGQVRFFGDSEKFVRLQFEDHLAEVGA